MIYENLFEKIDNKCIRAGIIGTGTYGISLLARAQSIRRLEIPVVCDRDPETAQRACRRAGIPEEKIAICSSRKKLLQTMESGKCAIAENYALLMDVPLDVIVECTGNPEAGACHAELAIKNGLHVAMVTKETDAVIGPILNKLADRAGVIYTPVDGDQHGLLIGLVSWATSIGLEVVCGGKARPYDFVYDEEKRTVSNGVEKIILSKEEMQALQKIIPGKAVHFIEKRRKIFNHWPQIAEADLCESVVTANATGLLPDTCSMHAPIVRTTEIPEVLGTKKCGGILNKKGAIDIITCLRRADEAGLGGGVFLVFYCQNDDAWNFVKEKGLLVNHRGTCGVVYRPYHLLGMETPISILCAGLLNVSTGSQSYEPRVDLVAKTTRDLKAGSAIQYDNGNSANPFEHLIIPSASVGRDNPIPYYMALGNRLKVNVPSATIIREDMVTSSPESRLWGLRRQQDQVFLKPGNQITANTNR
jgi:predicted homoserine dehydrogenase-like protein